MSKLDDVVEELFGTLQKHFPLANRASFSRNAFEHRVDRFYADAHEVRKKHGYWLLGWARVIFKFQQRLIAAGYPAAGVKPLVLGMIMYSYNAK